MKHINREEYAKFVKEITPKHNLFRQMIRAFFVGGMICVIGQGIIHFLENVMGIDVIESRSICSIVLILISALLTGMNIYPKIAKYGGAGALVPITGFANAVAAPAIEYKKEGQVFGIGCKIFTIAGPVILYGIITSFLCGIWYWIL